MTEPQELLHRMVATDVAATDGRTLEGRIVPYNTPAQVSDPGRPPYLELFAPGCFGRQVNAPNRVDLRFEHRDGLTDRLGRGIELRDSDAELWGSFKVADGPIGDHALALVDDGVVSGFSVGFYPDAREHLNAKGQVVRKRCRLVEVSLVPQPAYAGTEVVHRSRALTFPEPLEPDPAQVERLRRIGVVVVEFD